MAFTTAPHDGPLGRTFSLVSISSPQVRLLALKKAEESDEIVVRLVETDGRPAMPVHVSFGAPIRAIREVDAAERTIRGPAENGGVLVKDLPLRLRARRAAGRAHAHAAVRRRGADPRRHRRARRRRGAPGASAATTRWRARGLRPPDRRRRGEHPDAREGHDRDVIRDLVDVARRQAESRCEPRGDGVRLTEETLGVDARDDARHPPVAPRPAHQLADERPQVLDPRPDRLVHDQVAARASGRPSHAASASESRTRGPAPGGAGGTPGCRRGACPRPSGAVRPPTARGSYPAWLRWRPAPLAGRAPSCRRSGSSRRPRWRRPRGKSRAPSPAGSRARRTGAPRRRITRRRVCPVPSAGVAPLTASAGRAASPGSWSTEREQGQVDAGRRRWPQSRCS